jgi:hypothetical protein
VAIARGRAPIDLVVAVAAVAAVAVAVAADEGEAAGEAVDLEQEVPAGRAEHETQAEVADFDWVSAVPIAVPPVAMFRRPALAGW